MVKIDDKALNYAQSKSLCFVVSVKATYVWSERYYSLTAYY